MTYNLPNSNNLDIHSLTNIFKYVTNSYKYYWFYALLDELKKGNKVIDFRTIVIRMIAKCWYPIIEFKLNLGSQDKLDRLVRYIHKNYGFKKDIKPDDLMGKIENINDKNLDKQIKYFYKYVPFRLLTPFFRNNIRGVKDHLKNNMIADLSYEKENAIYKINEEDNRIIINDRWFDYLLKNISIVEGWVKYNLINYLQDRNPNVPAIPYKLEPVYQRKMNKQKKFWKEITKIIQLKDIYTKEIIRLEDISIDHFIPWSFVLHDKNWNLIPTFKSINSSKSDSLPELNSYFNDFADVQFRAFDLNRRKRIDKKLLEDYYMLDSQMDKYVKEDNFKEILEDNIYPLYRIARNTGFSIWDRNLA
ncbi:MAG: HNH endonuclease [Candidatus Mcinerneyibacterium aminivorans]|uniref:HNH endonuclease n=1 Tax=Candidatus Mcinerneyibacterium aminivorans TaxID=2703815 RepID=A0A5D0MC07_9BACT|nr:MAG: HNH endonuclease [Candidatus Mcinerneyibacterium aminivorans]